MKHCFESEIRYSETDQTGCLSVKGLIDYFQDVSTMQSMAVGQMPSKGEKPKAGWVLSYWHIEIDRLPYVGSKVEAGTFACDFHGAFGRRNFYLKDESGHAAVADSLWAYVDAGKGRPVKPAASVVESYGSEEPLPMYDYGRKIQCPRDIEADMQPCAPFHIRRFELDTNSHMNNAWYVELAMELAHVPPERTGCIRVEYKYPARQGDKVLPYILRTQERILVALCTEELRPYALVEFRERTKESLLQQAADMPFEDERQKG